MKLKFTQHENEYYRKFMQFCSIESKLTHESSHYTDILFNKNAHILIKNYSIYFKQFAVDENVHV